MKKFLLALLFCSLNASAYVLPTTFNDGGSYIHKEHTTTTFEDVFSYNFTTPYSVRASATESWGSLYDFGISYDGTSFVSGSTLSVTTGIHEFKVSGKTDNPWGSGYNLAVTPVPEPTTWLMLILGLILVVRIITQGNPKND